MIKRNPYYAARIHHGSVKLLEPAQLTEAKRVLVTVLDDVATPRVQSTYAGAVTATLLSEWMAHWTNWVSLSDGF